MGDFDFVRFGDLKGLTLIKCDREGEGIVFATEDRQFRLYHLQDCCEDVWIEDIAGDLQDLVGNPILLAEESTNEDLPPPKSEYAPESYTWTFYRLATIKGYVTIRFYGQSNGYYCETADLREEGLNDA